MQLGIESFVQNQQGYSFMVVRAPIEAVAKALKTASRSPNTSPTSSRSR